MRIQKHAAGQERDRKIHQRIRPENATSYHPVANGRKDTILWNLCGRLQLFELGR